MTKGCRCDRYRPKAYDGDQIARHSRRWAPSCINARAPTPSLCCAPCCFNRWSGGGGWRGCVDWRSVGGWGHGATAGTALCGHTSATIWASVDMFPPFTTVLCHGQPSAAAVRVLGRTYRRTARASARLPAPLLRYTVATQPYSCMAGSNGCWSASASRGVDRGSVATTGCMIVLDRMLDRPHLTSPARLSHEAHEAVMRLSHESCSSSKYRSTEVHSQQVRTCTNLVRDPTYLLTVRLV
eukprot:SAG25_NODE_3247_length_1160_cov_0.688973_1_plen_240_part_00